MTEPTPLTDPRTRATEVATDIATRLADPAAVVDHARSWQPASLGEGHAGIALLFAELAADDPGARRAAHAHITAAAPGVSNQHPSLFTGAPALAFAADRARRGPGDYDRLLTRLDELVADRARTLINAENERMAAGRPLTETSSYDLINGLVGLGVHLLNRDSPVVRDVLTCLVAMTEPVRVQGVEVPGWWVDAPPAPGLPTGHFNLGLAHGVTGLLPLLVRARGTVPGLDEAIERVRTWLAGLRLDGEHGTCWPSHVTWPDEAGPVPHEINAWCYGTAGVAHALQLSSDPAGTDLAVGAMRSALAAPREAWGLVDSSLCHGLAGLLTVTQTMVENGATALQDDLDALAVLLLDAFEPESPFGYRYTYRADPQDRAGFLEGVAGIALALLRYARGSTATSWPTCLLL
ncbi:hypothetical protein Lesp02_78030 [Lentzea sp. NBRC 105346]|uniref:lanthionine synthetase C family protein n=1 Tax=Lentzea sp. NBRC 105346 TaxID=3032205 RepID=UPI0024A2B854|nr:lanthionine synthetase C family protein [Lentzea sp. NBRC 105346]GLZ35616.1 hypothetical protein Lesp02_78030 [Lentzea sp. NBRC 105346]